MDADLEVVRDAFDAFSRGDFDRWVDLLDPEVEWVTEDMIAPIAYSGHAGVRKWASEVFDALGSVTLEIRELQAVDEQVFVAFDIAVSGRASGISGRVQRGAVAQVRRGKITYYRSYRDEREARATVGLATGR